MPTTLTLGGSGFTNDIYNTTADYTVVDNTKVNDTIVIGSLTQTQETFFFNGANSATLFTDPANGTATKVSLDLGNGNDTLLVNARLIGNNVAPSSLAASKIDLGGGNDSVTVNQYVQRYNIQLGGGDDTLVINEFTATSAADVKDSSLNLGTGADTLLVTADLTAVNINAGSGAADGSDTIVLRGTNDTGVTIANFNLTGGALSDTLIINAISFSAADYSITSTEVHNSLNLLDGSSASIDNVNEWLSQGNSITLI
jgi:hypothetical protein